MHSALDRPVEFSGRTAFFHTTALLGLMVLAGIPFALVCSFGDAVARATSSPPLWWADHHSPWITAVGNTVGFAFGLSYALRRAPAGWRDLFSSQTASPRLFAVLLVTLVGFRMVQSEVSNVLVAFAPPPSWLKATFRPLHDLAHYPVSAPVALLVVAPFTEELFFRGLLLRRMLAAGPSGRAIWTSALLFMVFHLNPWQFPVALLAGLLLGWVYTRTRSLGLCVAGHAFINGSGLLARGLPFTVAGFNADPAPAHVAFQPWWFDALGAAILAAGLLALARLMPIPPQPPHRPHPPPAAARAETVVAQHAPDQWPGDL